MIPISVCIIAKNEEKNIAKCLAPLADLPLEIIIADTGSTYRTKEVAKQYGAKVYDFQWIDDFSAARNFCAANAKNNWILAIDCDEYVSELNTNVLRIMMQKFPKYVGAIQIKNIILRPNGMQGVSTDTIVRLYNRNYYHFYLLHYYNILEPIHHPP